MNDPIYLDYMATTPLDEEVGERMKAFLSPKSSLGNGASATHLYGWRAKEAIEIARAQVADLIQANPEEIVWTSGATESNNLVIKGVAEFFEGKENHFITVCTEHPSVLAPYAYLEKKGGRVTYLPVNEEGLVDVGMLEKAIEKNTRLISVMHVNNEIGVIQNIEAMGAMAKKAHVLFHVDGAQSLGKIPVNVATATVDFLSLTAHKLYGPKGIGALYVSQRAKTRLRAQIEGGGHERGLRSGTLPTHQIVGMGEAFAKAKKVLKEEASRIETLRNQLWREISTLDKVTINGNLCQSIPGILNIHLGDTDGEALLLAVQPFLALSLGSACASLHGEPSHVLMALGRNGTEARNSLRISLGRNTTEQEVMEAGRVLKEKIQWVRSLSPLWSE